eukprot:COSAG04_NODE_4247_length_2208_cov_1.237553_1_plen_460_part_00
MLGRRRQKPLLQHLQRLQRLQRLPMSMRDYAVLRELGSGAFGSVVLAQQGSCQYCIKRISVANMGRREREAAIREAEILKEFNHPNVVQYKEQFIENGTLYIVMEFAEDGDLHARLKRQRGRPLPEGTILDWFAQICLAMKHVHDQRVLHRDIKTQNIFLTDGGSIVKLGDFGISRVLSGTMDKARTHVGTPYYMSPEICKGAPYDQKSDVWSLGCVLYELAVQKHPFDAGNLAALVLQITRGKFKPPPVSYSSDLRRLITDMLSQQPDQRPNIDEVLARPIMQKRVAQFLVEPVTMAVPVTNGKPVTNCKPVTMGKPVMKGKAAEKAEKAAQKADKGKKSEGESADFFAEARAQARARARPKAGLGQPRSPRGAGCPGGRGAAAAKARPRSRAGADGGGGGHGAARAAAGEGGRTPAAPAPGPAAAAVPAAAAAAAVLCARATDGCAAALELCKRTRC